jgi:hypothetical protein
VNAATSQAKGLAFWVLILFTGAIGAFTRDVAKLGIPAPVPGGTLYATEIVLALLSTYALFGLAGRARHPGLHKPLWSECQPLLFLALIVLINLARSSDPQLGVVVRKLAAIYYILFFPLTVLIIGTRRRARQAVTLLAASGAISLGVIMFRLLTGEGGVTSTGALRYGNAEVGVIFIVIAHLFTEPVRRWKWWRWALLLASCGVVVFLIQHRSATLALVGVLATVVLINARSPGVVLLKVGLIGVSLAFLSAYFAWVLDSQILESTLVRIQTIGAASDDPNVSQRLEYWLLALRSMSIPVDWMIGVEWTTLLDYNPRELELFSENLLVLGFHSSPLFFLYQTGIFGLLALARPIVRGWRRALTKHNRRTGISEDQALAAGSIGLFFFSLFNVVFEVPYTAVVFWVTVGLIWVLQNAPNDASTVCDGGPPGDS